MLAKLFPRRHCHYASLPIFGSIMEGFVRFHIHNGYSRIPIKLHVRATGKIDAMLRKEGCRSLKEVTREKLHACGPRKGHSQENINMAATLRLLERYLDELEALPKLELDAVEGKVREYAVWLEGMRGLAESTVSSHSQTVRCFLQLLNDGDGLKSLATLTSNDIEQFVKLTGERLSRASLQHSVAHLRSFLRYLAIKGKTPVGLDRQIDTPRVYREERLPKTIPWEAVQTLIDSVDRATVKGRRDYAMFQLMVNYGLRACDVVGLKLDDLDWRRSQLVASQHKTGTSLSLPIIEPVGKSLIDWLSNGRPAVDQREVFVRLRGPHGILKPTAVADAFQFWAKHAAITLPTTKGVHCIRHSFAMRMLRQGVSLKTVGDILGHRNRESTCVYIRLALNDLLEVSLNLPNGMEEGVNG